MLKTRPLAAAALTLMLSGALAAAPLLTVDAVAKTAKSKKTSKTTTTDATTTEAAPAAETAAPVPPAPPEQQVATSNPAATIPAVLQASGQFTILLKAVQATNLTSVLGGPTPLTVFAPTDAAFNALPPGALTTLMLPANADKLQKILTYHVVATKLPAASIKGHAAGPVPTANGASVTVDATKGAIKVGDAIVIQSDVMASNGVIHVIDKVLLPPGMALPSGPAAAAMPMSPGMAAPSTAPANAPTGAMTSGAASSLGAAPNAADHPTSATSTSGGSPPPQ